RTDRAQVGCGIGRCLAHGPKHGYGVSRWIDRVTEGTLLVEEGSLYPALHRVERKGWVEAEWGRTDTGRRARFYSLTPAGEEHLAVSTRQWRAYSRAIERALSAEGEAVS
ncbi:MAG: PadR family transcriptional regulator, partial [Longimicrobiales bacterium]|nr:PadR family transcriptional regulator [Longimicrobiales bacterium]